MDLRLTEEQRAVREAFARLFNDESTPQRVRTAETTGLDQRLWERFAAMGAIGIGVPAESGGGGGGLFELALVAEEAGRRLAPIPVAEPAVAARLLARLGEKELLAPALEGSTILSLTARVGEQFLVDGAVADAVLTMRRGSLRYVARPPGVPRMSRHNVGALPLARWDAAGEGRSLSDEAEATELFDRALDEVRVLRAALLVGLAGEAIDIGSGYAKVREAFGVPIGTYQAVAHPLADAVTALDGARLLVWKACWALDGDRDDGPELAAMAFVFAAETAYQAAGHSLHIHGGYGFMEEYDIQLYYRRAKAWAVSFADPRRELLTVADRRFGPVPAGRG